LSKLFLRINILRKRFLFTGPPRLTKVPRYGIFLMVKEEKMLKTLDFWKAGSHGPNIGNLFIIFITGCLSGNQLFFSGVNMANPVYNKTGQSIFEYFILTIIVVSVGLYFLKTQAYKDIQTAGAASFNQAVSQMVSN